MAQQLVVGATQVEMEFEAGTQAIGFHRFTIQLLPAAAFTHLETEDATVFGVQETLLPGTHTLTYATIGVDGVTVLGPVVSTTQAVGAQVTLLVAAGITAQIITVP